MSVRHAVVAALLSSSAALAFSSLARAADAQMVVFDETYTQELNGNVQGETFHHGISPKATEPDSWLTPIAYAKGTAYLYLEVLAKPSNRDTILTVCFDGPRAGYGCIDSNTYKTTGSYMTVAAMKDGPVWQYNDIAWGKRRDDYHLVIKDPALGGTQGGKPATDYVPTTLRAVLTIVPPGGTYTPPAKGTGMPGGGSGGADGGVKPTDGAVVTVDAAAAADAAPPTGPGSGGSSGSGGTSGSGGASGSGGSTASGGSSGSGGTTATGGSTQTPTATGGVAPGDIPSPPHGCAMGGSSRSGAAMGVLFLATLVALRRRRRP
jgi:MYXO-CTERM domain-containing protein